MSSMIPTQNFARALDQPAPTPHWQTAPKRNGRYDPSLSTSNSGVVGRPWWRCWRGLMASSRVTESHATLAIILTAIAGRGPRGCAVRSVTESNQENARPH